MSEEITKRLPEPVESASMQTTLDGSASSGTRPRRRRGPRWPFVLALLTLIFGFVLGLVVSLIFVLSHSTKTLPGVISTNQAGNILVEAQPELLTLITEKSLLSAGIPGSFSNIQFQLANGDRMTMTGTYTYSIFGIGLTQPFTMQLQPYVHSCQLQVHVTSVDIAGIAITSFVSAFEGNINQELKLPSSGLPDGLTYCMSGVRTETTGLYVTCESQVEINRVGAMLAITLSNLLHQFCQSLPNCREHLITFAEREAYIAITNKGMFCTIKCFRRDSGDTYLFCQEASTISR